MSDKRSELLKQLRLLDSQYKDNLPSTGATGWLELPKTPKRKATPAPAPVDDYLTRPYAPKAMPPITTNDPAALVELTQAISRQQVPEAHKLRLRDQALKLYGQRQVPESEPPYKKFLDLLSIKVEPTPQPIPPDEQDEES